MSDKKYKCEVNGCDAEFNVAIALEGHKKSHRKEAQKECTKEIKIFHQEGEADSVQVAMHGKDTPNTNWQIRRGEWVTVPDAVINVLNDAVIETAEFVEDPNVPGKFTRRPIQKQRYHFQVRDIRG